MTTAKVLSENSSFATFFKSYLKSQGFIDDNTEAPSYVFAFGKDSIKIALQSLDSWFGKTILIYNIGDKPMSIPDHFKGRQIVTLFLGEVYGEDIVASGIAGKILQEAAQGNLVVANLESAKIFPIYKTDAASDILKSAFSFWGAGSAVIGKELDSKYFAREVLALSTPQTSFYNNSALPSLTLSLTTNDNLNIKGLSETLNALKAEYQKNEIANVPQVPKNVPVTNQQNASRHKLHLPKISFEPSFGFSFKIATALVLLFIVPLSALGLSSTLLWLSAKIDNTYPLMAAQSVAHFASVGAVTHAKGPLKTFYRDVGKVAEEQNKTATILYSQKKINRAESQILSQVLGDTNGADIASLGQILVKNLYKLDTSFSFSGSKDNIKSPLKNAIAIATHLPDLIGLNGERSYLLLLQNNLSPAATGGEIEAYGVLTFENGILKSLKVEDSKVIEDSLKGFIKPPQPIATHKGLNTWVFSDSNWDPEFSTTGRRAEWFLSKGKGLKVDGVIATNLELIKIIIEKVGPINIDSNRITTENIYLEASAVGTARLFESALNAALSSAPEVQLAIINSLGSLGTSGDILVFLNDTKTQNVLGVTDLGGGLLPPSCNGNCQAILTGIIETNMGTILPGANIERYGKLSVDFQETSVNYSLTLLLKNIGSEDYKTYIRVLAPPDSKFDLATSVAPGLKAFLRPDFKIQKERGEAGVYIEVKANESTELTFKWENKSVVNFNENGLLRLLWHRQPGIVLNGGELNISLPAGTYVSDVTPSLTEGATFTYNTHLSQDLFINLLISHDNPQP